MLPKILIFNSHFGKSGPNRQLKYLVSEIQDSHDVEIISLLPEKKVNVIADFQGLGIKIKTSSRLNFLYHWFLIIYYRFSYKEAVFHSVGLVPDVLCYFFAPSKRWLSVSRNFPIEDYPPKFGSLKGHFLAAIHTFVQAHCRFLVTCSFSLSSKYEGKGINNSAIQNCVPFQEQEFSNDPSIGGSTQRFLYVGNLIERKKVDSACDFFQSLKIPGSRLDIVGAGVSYDRIKKEFSKNKDIHFHGFQSSVNDYYKNTDFLLNFSDSEGLPNAVLEALSYGVPCILSDIPAHYELKSTFSDSILIVKELSVDGNYEDAFEFINTITDELKKETIGLVRENFGTLRLGMQFSNLYSKILKA